MNMPSL
ncbi:hypothetical protein RDI58_004334 [Solanum bulbocastanum]